MKKNAKLWWLMPLAAVLVVWGGVFLASCSGDDGDDGDPYVPPASISNTSLYRLGATDDCDFVDGAISDFGSNGAYLYYPVKLNLDSDTAEFSANVTVTGTDGMLGIGLINVKAGEVPNYVFATPAQKVRYKNPTKADGSGWTTTSLSNATISVNTPYTFKVTLSGKKITFDILDASGTNVATKGNSWSTWIANDGDVYLAIGGPSGDTASISYKDITVKVNDGETYTISKIEDAPDKSALALNGENVRVKKDETAKVSFTALDKSGNSTSVSVDAEPQGIVEVSADASEISIKGLKGGSATITVTNTANPDLKKTLSVTVLAYNTEEDAYTLNAVYPANTATNAYEDGEYMLTFDAPPTLQEGGSIEIYDAATSAEVDSIAFAKETQTLFGTTFGVEDQLVRVDGNAVYFTPHIGKIENGKTYYVVISSGAITGKMNGKDFDGLTNDAGKTQWKFTTRTKPSVSTTITVDGAQGSTANFRTIQGALNAIGTSEGSYKIEVAKGTYRELLYFNGKADIEIEGQTTTKYGADVLVAFANAGTMNNDKNNDEKRRCLFEFIGGNLVLENIYFKNTFMRSNKVWTTTGNTQAEVLGFDSGAGKWVAAYNCGLYSHQDTIRTVQKAWFYNCYITGDVDFIWQERNGLVQLVEKSEIVALGDDTDKAYLVAPGADPKSPAGKGSVILNSTVDVQCKETYYGRTPWSSGRYNNAAIVNTKFTTSGSGKLYPCYFNQSCKDDIDDKYVGWKTYKVTLPDGTAPNDNGYCVALEEDFYKKEYSGRRAILNRVYDENKGTFVHDSSPTTNWKIDELIAEQHWTVDEDTSSELAEGEAQLTVKEYDIAALALTASGMTAVDSNEGKALTDGSSDDGVLAWKNLKAAKVAYGTMTQASTEITLKVSGKSVISWQGSSYSNGTISVKDANGKSLVTAATANTAVDKSSQGFLYTGTGETTLTLTFTGTTYINNIAIKTLTDETNGIASISLSDKGVIQGNSTELSATVATKYLNDFSYVISWTTSAPSIANITSSDGTKCTVKGEAVGTATITATADGKSGTCTFTVNPADAQPETAEYNLKGGVGTPFTSSDGFLKVTADNDNNSHGLIMKDGSNFTLKVRAGAKITLGNCAYDNSYKIDITNSSNTVLSTLSISAGDNSNDSTSTSFEYSGDTTDTLTFTWKDAGGNTYLHYVNVKYE